jgi:hypothetical protein
MGLPLFPCTCTAGALLRVGRPWWIRLLYPRRHLYQCGNCLRLMLLPEDAVTQMIRERFDRTNTGPPSEAARPAGSA